MIHAYHVIWGAYGFWLPNDPRGSWSDFVGSWELARFGRTTRSIERQDIDPSRWAAWCLPQSNRSGIRRSSSMAGKHATGRGFAAGVNKSHLTIWACSILPEHVHLVVARHTYKVEQICNLLKGEATKELKRESIHPQQKFHRPDGKLPSTWAEGQWKVYLDTEEAIESAVHYVEENPVKEDKPSQQWSFVTPFTGLDRSGWTTYH